jgi:hypothetical protein
MQAGKFQKIRTFRISFKIFREYRAGKNTARLQRMDSAAIAPYVSVRSPARALMMFAAGDWHRFCLQ